MLYAVSPKDRTMYSVDIMADSVVHWSIFPSGTPTAISVYIPETSRSSDGKLFKPWRNVYVGYETMQEA